MIIQGKTCLACRESKPISDFRRDTRTRDGIAVRCVDCASADLAGRWAKRREMELTANPSLMWLTKTCPKCETIKPLIDFVSSKNRKDGRNTHCRDCQSEKMRNWRRDNAPTVKLKEREDWLQRKYGISTSEYDELLARQDGACALCGSPGTLLSSGELRLAVDHCHDSGRVRGILCLQCNQALSVLEAHDGWEQRARTYLKAKYLSGN